MAKCPSLATVPCPTPTSTKAYNIKTSNTSCEVHYHRKYVLFLLQFKKQLSNNFSSNMNFAKIIMSNKMGPIPSQGHNQMGLRSSSPLRWRITPQLAMVPTISYCPIMSVHLLTCYCPTPVGIWDCNLSATAIRRRFKT